MFKLVFNSQLKSEALRNAMLVGNVEFEDECIQQKEYQGHTVNGALLIHPNGFISKSPLSSLLFFGIKQNLYPKSAAEMAEVDELLYELRQFHSQFAKCQDQAQADKVLAATLLPLERRFAKMPGKYFSGERVTIADFELSALIGWLLTRNNVENESFTGAFPNLLECHSLIKKNNSIVKYAASRKLQRMKSVKSGGTTSGASDSSRGASTKPPDDW
eukprot:GEMP01062310.1.p1 GENE.GEMP01062310.1~~GEMP01062310.1.p1  ORF type:complete len:217 (+),score=38.18 GEMP01062310.1:128-778(+)